MSWWYLFLVAKVNVVVIVGCYGVGICWFSFPNYMSSTDVGCLGDLKGVMAYYW